MEKSGTRSGESSFREPRGCHRMRRRQGARSPSVDRRPPGLCSQSEGRVDDPAQILGWEVMNPVRSLAGPQVSAQGGRGMASGQHGTFTRPPGAPVPSPRSYLPPCRRDGRGSRCLRPAPRRPRMPEAGWVCAWRAVRLCVPRETGGRSRALSQLRAVQTLLYLKRGGKARTTGTRVPRPRGGCRREGAAHSGTKHAQHEGCGS